MSMADEVRSPSQLLDFFDGRFSYVGSDVIMKNALRRSSWSLFPTSFHAFVKVSG